MLRNGGRGLGAPCVGWPPSSSRRALASTTPFPWRIRIPCALLLLWLRLCGFGCMAVAATGCDCGSCCCGICGDLLHAMPRYMRSTLRVTIKARPLGWQQSQAIHGHCQRFFLEGSGANIYWTQGHRIWASACKKGPHISMRYMWPGFDSTHEPAMSSKSDGFKTSSSYEATQAVSKHFSSMGAPQLPGRLKHWGCQYLQCGLLCSSSASVIRGLSALGGEQTTSQLK